MIYMNKCIYCHKSTPEVTFNGKEHVLPRLMGTYEQDLTLRGFVCDVCNSIIFNKLETKFKEDTEVGINYQMYNFTDSYQVRVRANNVKTKFDLGLPDRFFNDWFPFLKLQDGGWKVFLLPQIKVRRFGDTGYIVLLVDEVKKLDRTSRKFCDLKRFLSGATSKDVSIYVHDDSDTGSEELEDAIELVNALGITYKEGNRKFVDSQELQDKTFHVSMDVTITHEVARVYAKIAFNYFAYCAIADGNEGVLYHKNFSKIRQYILGVIDLPMIEVVNDVKSTPIIFEETLGKGRMLAHMLTFRKDGQDLISELSFLGGKILTIRLGCIPTEIDKSGFGCGHVFDPVNHHIAQLTQDPDKWGSGNEVGFGLFSRV